MNGEKVKEKRQIDFNISNNKSLKENCGILLKCSFEKLLVNDYELLQDKVHEVAITSLLSKYISAYIEDRDLSVDVEYNRMITSDDIEKRISKAIYITSFEKERRDLHEEIRCYIRPDIIIHQRRTNDNNILWMEFKIGEDQSKCNFDRQKAWYAITQLHYKVGICVLIDIKNQIIVFQWININEIDLVEYAIRDGKLEEQKRYTQMYTPA